MVLVIGISLSIGRMAKFEFWPYWLFYFPAYFYGLFLALKAESFMYFSAANPGMKYGGVMGESKYKVLSAIPSAVVPKTLFFPTPQNADQMLSQADREGIDFPFILKPDVGERGKDVELIQNSDSLQAYLRDKNFDLVLQEFVPYELELGVFYHRMPDAQNGHVTSVVQKGFLSVKGDGRSTLGSLIKSNERARDRLDYFEGKYGKRFEDVLPAGKGLLLEPIGNHCRGTMFINANHLIDARLVEVFDKIALEIEGFFYGRFDLKVPCLEDLYAGKNIKVLELNGVSSEVAHVYDPNYKLLAAYRDIFTHMKYIYQISKKNHEHGVSYDSLKDFLRDLWRHLRRD
jgi:hypothetical protein